MTDSPIDTKEVERGSAATPLAELLAAPVRLGAAPVTTIERLAWPLAWVTAVAAHAVVLYALAREPDDFLAGGGGQQLDAISVTIVSSSVLESRDLDRSRPTAPAAASSVETTDGTTDSTPAPEQREQKKEDLQKERQKDKKPQEPVRTADAILEVAPPKQQSRTPQSPAAPAGGASARGEAAADAKAAGPAAASRGAVREYARYVTQALGKTRPKNAGGYGTVRIKFVIAAGGSLASVEITKSSGSQKLDETALAAVRRAAFPVPPAGMTVAQLTFEIPYYFR